ncbi:2-polyprenyl-3-methyl-6-methoxy-1,4-benzoquinone monooxygenase [soil metagenome]
MTSIRSYSPLDSLLISLDQGIRTLLHTARSERANPAVTVIENSLTQTQKQLSAALMRVNHTGEVCAQALYQGQAFTAADPRVRDKLAQSAIEENDHLLWCQTRIKELGGHTSYLNPLWYMGSLVIGVIAGKLGDGWSLGFLAETEYQVTHHLEKHLQQLPVADQKSQVIIQQMRLDEMQHAQTAETMGALPLPEGVKWAMQCLSKIMTTTVYWV